jgi:uncharacterized membrane protein YraQ (UPF0718 family)
MEPEPLEGGFRDKLLALEGWRRIAHAFFMEWKMVWKEILFGFTIAGFISVMVPQSLGTQFFSFPTAAATACPLSSAAPSDRETSPSE